MGFKYRRPSIKIGGTTIRKNKNGYSISGKTLLGGRKTYNTATGKATTTYQTGIKGLTYQTTSGGKKKGEKVVKQNNTPWYRSDIWILVLTILFFPLGLALVWMHPGYSRHKKIVWTAITAGVIFLALTGWFGAGLILSGVLWVWVYKKHPALSAADVPSGHICAYCGAQLPNSGVCPYCGGREA